MTTTDIFSNVSDRQIEGIMMHEQLADYFDFLGLQGFKRVHEYQFLDENVELRGIHRYFINHFNMLLNNNFNVNKYEYIPIAWNDVKRESVDNEAKKQAIKTNFETWVTWETETKKQFENAYCNLCDLHEIAGAIKIKELIRGVDEELKRACRMHVTLKSLDYDLCSIYLMQDALHEEYRGKEKELGVDIC